MGGESFTTSAGKESCRVFVCVTRICDRFGEEKRATSGAGERSARIGIGSRLGFGNRAGPGEARRTSLAFIRIRSRRAPHVGQSDASGNASAGRSHTPLSTACVEERRGMTVRGWFSWKRARNDAETSEGARAYPLPSRIVSGLRRRLPGLRRSFILRHPARASPRARRLCRASSRTTKTRKFRLAQFCVLAKKIFRRRRRNRSGGGGSDHTVRAPTRASNR